MSTSCSINPQLTVFSSGHRPQPLFYEELSTVLETLVVHACPVVIGGDINMHLQDTGDTDARRLADLLSSFDMVQVQHVSSPTHRHGNTLKIVFCENSNGEKITESKN